MKTIAILIMSAGLALAERQPITFPELKKPDAMRVEANSGLVLFVRADAVSHVWISPRTADRPLGEGNIVMKNGHEFRVTTEQAEKVGRWLSQVSQ